MRTYLFINLIFVIVFHVHNSHADMCGCKEVRDCYREMVESLRDKDEESCVEEASIGVSTIMIYLKAIKTYCAKYITIKEDTLTYEGRHLYEVTLNIPINDAKDEAEKPVVMIDAGQQADTESVGLALFLIEQLLACEENADMITKAKWVILPSTNPDGMEYGRYNRITWIKNVRASEDGLSYGVDVSRNFDYQWGACDPVESGFSPEFPGVSASSENETLFIKNIYMKHKVHIKLYLSIRRDGHGILYPYAYSNKKSIKSESVLKIAGDVAAKVNQRAGGVQIFMNDTIYAANGKPHCGHSVDHVFNQGTLYAYELRVFIGRDKRIMAQFQQLPKGYEASLRLGYFSGIRELYNQIINTKKSKSVFR